VPVWKRTVPGQAVGDRVVTGRYEAGREGEIVSGGQVEQGDGVPKERHGLRSTLSAKISHDSGIVGLDEHRRIAEKG